MTDPTEHQPEHALLTPPERVGSEPTDDDLAVEEHVNPTAVEDTEQTDPVLRGDYTDHGEG